MIQIPQMEGVTFENGYALDKNGDRYFLEAPYKAFLVTKSPGGKLMVIADSEQIARESVCKHRPGGDAGLTFEEIPVGGVRIIPTFAHMPARAAEIGWPVPQAIPVVMEGK